MTTNVSTQKGHHHHPLVDPALFFFFDDDESSSSSSSRRPISFVSSLKKVDKNTNPATTNDDDDESSPSSSCFFFPRFDDALETFSLDALLLSTTVEKSPVVVLERYATHPDQPVSKPKAIVYDDWYARAKEALTTNDFSSNLSTKTKKKNKKYAFTPVSYTHLTLPTKA